VVVASLEMLSGRSKKEYGDSQRAQTMLSPLTPRLTPTAAHSDGLPWTETEVADAIPSMD
jgi:hypothetical protein